MEPKIKAGIAAGAALAALGLATYLGYSAMGGGRTIRTASEASADQASDRQPTDSDSIEDALASGERRVELDGPPPAWMEAAQSRAMSYGEDYAFPDDDAASTSFDEGAVDFALRAESDDSFGTLGISARRGLVDSYKMLMQPLIDADKDAFERALRDLGAPNPQGGLALYDRLVGYLENARVAVASARIRQIDPSQPGALPMGMPNIPNMPEGAVVIPMMVGVMEFQDDDSGETTTVREVNIPLDTVFPGAREGAMNGARTSEVWAPAQFAGTRGTRADLGPSIFFAYDDQAKRWAPVAMRLALASESAASRLEQMMQNRQRAVED